MNKILYFDLVGGIAGDMAVAALVDLGVPLQHLRDGLRALNVEGLAIETSPATRHAIRGTRFVVSVPAEGQGHHAPAGNSVQHDRGSGGAHNRDHSHEHSHGHDPGDRSHGHGAGRGGASVQAAHSAHSHRTFRGIESLLSGVSLPGRAAELALKVFRKLAEAEGAVHGVPAQAVTFHEVGAWDSIADIVCAALAIDYLAPDAIYCNAVPLGQGAVDTAHGRMPIPAPATLLLLRGFEVVQGPPDYERTTPTGAAILAALAQPAPVPMQYTPQRVGVGVGTMDSPQVANILRAVVGHTAKQPVQSEIVECAEANLDDSNPEWIGYLMERLFAQGALDVVLIPVTMKKNRPGTTIQVLYPPELRPRMHDTLFAESTTLGVRYQTLTRAVLPREGYSVSTPWGDVQGKVSTVRGRRRFAPEYESCRALALKSGVSLREVYGAAERAFAQVDP